MAPRRASGASDESGPFRRRAPATGRRAKRGTAPDGEKPSAYGRALVRLARRDQSEEELRRYLASGGYPQDEICAALERLRRERWVDDRRLAERYSLSRLEHQGQGRRRIQADLARRGLAPDTVRAGLDAALGEVSETEALTAVARRYWVQQAKVEPPRRLRRLRVFLLRRGFPPDLVHNRLRAIWPRLSAAIEDVLPDNSWGEE